MEVIKVRNVHESLPKALKLLVGGGVLLDSRGGEVLQFPTPVTTVYERPLERVIFWRERDANPFFHLYEALWMLRGRNDVAGVARYASNMKDYSDNGEFFHGAYGHRWRSWEDQDENWDQLVEIVESLKKDPTDRRCVLSMWDANRDLSFGGKDLPCNTIATFQIGTDGRLNLTVFCRSNDIVWGCYGANAVQFAFLLEYMAHWIGVPVGTYSQVSVNWHGYLKTMGKVLILAHKPDSHKNPYEMGVRSIPLATPDLSIEELDLRIDWLLFQADHNGMIGQYAAEFNDDQPFFDMAYRVLKAHSLHKEGNMREAMNMLAGADQTADWVVAAKEWLERRVK